MQKKKPFFWTEASQKEGGGPSGQLKNECKCPTLHQRFTHYSIICYSYLRCVELTKLVKKNCTSFSGHFIPHLSSDYKFNCVKEWAKDMLIENSMRGACCCPKSTVTRIRFSIYMVFNQYETIFGICVAF